MIFAYLCRIASLAPLVILILKVHNHSWTVLSIYRWSLPHRYHVLARCGSRASR